MQPEAVPAPQEGTPGACPRHDAPSAWAREVVLRTVLALEPEAQPGSATRAQPALGVPADRRAALLAQAWDDLPAPTPADLAAAVAHLRRLCGQEYLLAADDLVSRFPTTGVPDLRDRDPRTTAGGGPG